MVKGDLKYNKIIRFLLERSLISNRQFEIIYKRMNYDRDEGISKGAYYRLLGQSRNKIEGVVYSLLLLSCIGMLDEKRQGILLQLLKQINVISSHDDIDNEALNDVINVIKELVKGMSKI